MFKIRQWTDNDLSLLTDKTRERYDTLKTGTDSFDDFYYTDDDLKKLDNLIYEAGKKEIEAANKKAESKQESKPEPEPKTNVKKDEKKPEPKPETKNNGKKGGKQPKPPKPPKPQNNGKKGDKGEKQPKPPKPPKPEPKQKPKYKIGQVFFVAQTFNNEQEVGDKVKIKQILSNVPPFNYEFVGVDGKSTEFVLEENEVETYVTKTQTNLYIEYIPAFLVALKKIRLMNKKKHTRKELLSVIQYINTAILENRDREVAQKRLAFNSEIEQLLNKITKALGKALEKNPNAQQFPVELTPEMGKQIDKYLRVINIYLPISLLKKYMKIMGQEDKKFKFGKTTKTAKDMAEKLLINIDDNLEEIEKTRFKSEIAEIRTILADFLDGNSKTLKITTYTLNGISDWFGKAAKAANQVPFLTNEGAAKAAIKSAVKSVERANSSLEKSIAVRDTKIEKAKNIQKDEEKSKSKEQSLIRANRDFTSNVEKSLGDAGTGANENEDMPETPISVENLLKKKFETTKTHGKWKLILGTPSKRLLIDIFGMPKNGKTTFALMLASYLSKYQNHNVLYVSGEQGKTQTLQQTIVEHIPQMHNKVEISGSIPENISDYDTVFIDSVTKLGLTPDDIENIKEQHPDISFILVHQVTKSGEIRGSNEHRHNTDQLINVNNFEVDSSGRYANEPETIKLKEIEEY